MDDPLSSLGLTAVTLYNTRPSAIDVLIKRPYRSTFTYPRVSAASLKRLERLARSGSAEIVQVPNSGQEIYFLFYWQKRFPLHSTYQSLPGIDVCRPPDLYTD